MSAPVAPPAALDRAFHPDDVGSLGPVVSIVMPTHGRRSSLLRVLHTLARQTLAPRLFEVIVICDGDVDGSGDACRQLRPALPYDLRIVEQANQGPAAARGSGVAQARTPLIVFLDDDVVPDDALLDTHLQAQRGHAARVTIGPLLPPPDERLSLWARWEERTLCRQYDDMTAHRWEATYRQFYTGNASVRRQQILDAGGFDPTYRRAEDVELARRLQERGLHFVFLPEARGWHYIRRSYAAWLRIPAAYGQADVAMARAGKGRAWMLDLVMREFASRRGAVRLLTHLCLGRPALTRAVVMALGWLASACDASGLRPVAYGLCSLIFNLRYYDGFATTLGGRAVFYRLLRTRRETLK